MDNGGDILQLCRLCLVKDDVNIPIFAEQGDIRQIFLKISSCLPVKVSREDKLPKKICDGCSYKLDMLYEFWNTTANAEKQLLSWLGEAGINAKLADGTISAVAQQIKPVETFVKQEAIDPSDIHTEDDDDKSYMFQQKFSVGEAGPSATVTSNDEPPPKRARRTAAVKAQIAMDPESDDDDDSGEPLTKVEDESEDSDGEDHEPPFVDVPSTSADDQPGPSGVGKDGAEAPVTEMLITPQIFKCDACYKCFLDLEDLDRHAQIHKEKTFSCDQCHKTFKRGHDLNRHKNTKHSNVIKYYNCDLCDKKFLRNNLLKMHIESAHHGKFKFRCDKCNKGCHYQSELERHIRNVHDDPKLTCEHCSKMFKDPWSFKFHIKTHDPNYKNTGIPCKLCHKVLRCPQSFRVHMKDHAGLNKRVCNVCGKVVQGDTTLRNHMRTHTGEKPFQCEICSKRFTMSQTLRIHQRVHTKDRPFICEICQKGFSQKASLKIHKRSHTGERPYSCSICDRKFITNALLKGHECTGIPSE